MSEHGELVTYVPQADINMQSRLRAIPNQFLVLLSFMERHGDLSKLSGPYNRIKADKLWEEVVQSLDAIDGGVKKSQEKWKRVWADWKTKTKKKAQMLRGQTNNAITQRLKLTNLEQRLLAVMGLATTVVSRGSKEANDDQSIQGDSSLSQQHSTLYIHTGESVEEEKIIFELTPPFAAHSMEGIEEIASSTLQAESEEPQRPPTPARSVSPAHSSIADTSEGAGQEHPTPTAAASPTPSSRPRGRALHRALKQVKTAFQQRTRDFANVEHRRLQLEEIRERNEHQRKTEKLRLEARRLDMEEQRNAIFASIANTLANILSQNS